MLSDDQIGFFNANGYLVVDDVVTDQLPAIHAEYAVLMDQLYADWQTRGLVGPALGFWDKLLNSYRAGCDWFQPMDISLPGDTIHPDTPFHFGPAVFDMLRHPRLLDVVQSLIGPEITSNPIQHVRIKPPSDDLRADEIRAHITATDWHQDRAVALAEADQTDMITVWLAITDATVENGCLMVQRKQTDQAMLPHCPRTQTGIADGFIDQAGAVPLPVRAGGVVIFHPLTPHASLPNTTQGFRWSFDLRYHVTGQPSGRAHFPEFIVRSATRPVLSDWRDWRDLWVEARARLAVNPHIPIHRWSGDAPYCA